MGKQKAGGEKNRFGAARRRSQGLMDSKKKKFRATNGLQRRKGRENACLPLSGSALMS